MSKKTRTEEIVEQIEQLYKKVSSIDLKNDHQPRLLKDIFERQKAKKPYEMRLDLSFVYFCSHCRNDLKDSYIYCPTCGQAINWEEGE